MDELLQKIMDDLKFARDGLQQAHIKANSVEALLVYDMIGEIAKLQNNVERLYNARQIPV